MTSQINKISKQEHLTKEKINQANDIIKILDYYTNVNNSDLTSDMLKEIAKHCNNLIISDY